jgi:polysaccharide pyruvyl transferase WcaK-like protein
MFAKRGGCEIDIVPYPPSHWLDSWQSWRYGEFLENLYSGIDTSRSGLDTLEQLCRARFSDQFERVMDADLVLFQGEGSIGGSRQFKRTQLFGLPFLAKKKFDKPVISLNQTIAFSTEHEAEMLKNILGSFDMNFVRETWSQELCQGVGWPEFGFIPDAAFFYKPKQKAQSSEIDDRYFCISGSAKLEAYDLDSYAQAIHEIATLWQMRPVFLYSRSSDAAVAKAYEKKYPNKTEVVSSLQCPDVDQMLDVLAGSELVIGGRYHTSISALSLNVPVILTDSNSHKSKGLVNLFDGNIRLVDHANKDEVSAAAEAIMSDPAGLRARIQECMARLARISDSEADNLNGFLDNVVATEACAVSRQPVMALNYNWARLAPMKYLVRRINLGIFDRGGLEDTSS